MSLSKPDLAQIEKFKVWIVARGAELLLLTNPYELVRFRANRRTSVVYANKKGHKSFAGDGAATWAAFVANQPNFRFVEKSARKMNGSVVVRTLVKRDGNRCFFCGVEFDDECPPTREHLVPRTAGGPDHISNQFLACGGCNAEVGHRSAAEKIRFRDTKRRGAGTVLLIDLRPLVEERAGLPGDPIREDLLKRIDAIIHHQPKEATDV